MQRYKNGDLDTSLRPKNGIARGLWVRVEGLKHARIKFIVAGAAFKVINNEKAAPICSHILSFSEFFVLLANFYFRHC